MGAGAILTVTLTAARGFLGSVLLVFGVAKVAEAFLVKYDGSAPVLGSARAIAATWECVLGVWTISGIRGAAAFRAALATLLFYSGILLGWDLTLGPSAPCPCGDGASRDLPAALARNALLVGLSWLLVRAGPVSRDPQEVAS